MPEFTSPKIASTLSRSISFCVFCTPVPTSLAEVFDQKLDLAAENAALFVDLGFGIFGAVDLALRQGRQHAGQRIDHADLDRLFAERRDDERRADNLAGAERDARLDQGAAADGHSHL